MLPICLGEATKIAGDILSGRKRYRFTIALGARTATGDIEGAVVETLPVPAVDRAAAGAVLQRASAADSMQVPPMYSAIKRDGQPLYKLARAGIEVERAPREIEICRAAACAWRDGAERSSSSRRCAPRAPTSGCWRRTSRVRSGTCGHVAQLRRLYVEPFERGHADAGAVAERAERGRAASSDRAGSRRFRTCQRSR